MQRARDHRSPRTIGHSSRTALRTALLSCLAVVGAWLFVVGPAVEMPIAPEAMTEATGHRYRVNVPLAALGWLPIAADSNLDPAASTAMVYEDGVPIGLAHRAADAVAALGRGRLSHWGNDAAQILYFSSSDGSDPRANRRAYVVRFVALPPAWLAVAAGFALLAACASFLARARPRWLVAAAVALAAALIGIWAWVFGGAVLISPDSATYIRFHAWVPVGYPLFVAGIASLLGYAALPAVQLLLLGLGALFLARAVGRFTGSRLAWAASLVVVAAYAPIMLFAGFILSEALYSALLLVCAASGLTLVKGFSKGAAVTFALGAVLAWTVRPAGVFVALVAGYLGLLLVRTVPRRTVLAWLVAPTAAGYLLFNVVQNEVRGPDAATQTGRILLAQVGLRFDPRVARPEHRADAERIAAALAPHKAAFDTLSSWNDRHAFAVHDYADRLNAVDAALGAGPPRNAPLDGAMLLELALDTIAARPVKYLRWVVEDVVWSWWTNVFASLARPPAIDLGWYADRPGERAELIRRFALPLTMQQVTLPEGRILAPAGRAVDLARRMLEAVAGVGLLVVGFGAFLLVAAIAAPFSSSLTLRGLGLLGAMVHGAIMVISATTAPIDRYVAPTDPLLLVAAVIALHGFARWLRSPDGTVGPR